MLHRDFQLLLNEEKRFEGIFILALMSYSIWFCVLIPLLSSPVGSSRAPRLQFPTQSFSILLSAYIVAGFVYEAVDLHIAEDHRGEASNLKVQPGPGCTWR